MGIVFKMWIMSWLFQALLADQLVYKADVANAYPECKLEQRYVPRKLNPCPAYILDFRCPRGDRGREGKRGVKGTDGMSGTPGPQGPLGPPGIDGAPGPQGPPGSTGLKGPKGVQGLLGMAGLTGPLGVQGPVGLIGLAGPQGLTGVVGPAGPLNIVLPHAYFYYQQSITNVYSLNQGSSAPFNMNGPYTSDTYSHSTTSPGWTDITVLKSGAYRIDFISWGQQSLEMTIYLNGLNTGQRFSTGNNR